VSARWYAITSWFRWHLPITREQALRFAEEETNAYFQVLDRRTKLALDLIALFAEPDPSAVRYRLAVEQSRLSASGHGPERHLRVIR
jgi:hypothetical protein